MFFKLIRKTIYYLLNNKTGVRRALFCMVVVWVGGSRLPLFSHPTQLTFYQSPNIRYTKLIKREPPGTYYNHTNQSSAHHNLDKPYKTHYKANSSEPHNPPARTTTIQNRALVTLDLNKPESPYPRYF